MRAAETVTRDGVTKPAETVTRREVFEKPDVEAKCQVLRDHCKQLEDAVRAMRGELSGQHVAEAWSQTMLAVRALEDARMRLGKVIQYNGDGVSCYDKE